MIGATGMKLWYQLVTETGAPLKGATAGKVEVADSADVEDLRFAATLFAL